jgi:hypothetical protein
MLRIVLIDISSSASYVGVSRENDFLLARVTSALLICSEKLVVFLSWGKTGDPQPLQKASARPRFDKWRRNSLFQLAKTYLLP